MPGPGGGETPFPVETMIRPGPSDISPLPPCQMPASLSVTPVSSPHSVVALVLTFTPSTNPVHGLWSQCDPNAA